MTLDDKRRRVHDKLAALPGVASLRRPVTDPDGEQFDLYYIRTGPPTVRPLVVIPGGPGMASIGHYQGLRRRAAAAGLDVIMVEHRGVGMSRHDDDGQDLSAESTTSPQYSPTRRSTTPWCTGPPTAATSPPGLVCGTPTAYTR
jgi:pimeloyl-ACP methyl ester carboxylesterase